MEMLPVTNVMNVITVVCAGIKAFVGAKADGKFDLADLGQLMIVLPHLAAAYEGIENVPAQILNLDDAEKAQLIAHIDAQLGEGAFEAIGQDILTGTLHYMTALAKIKAMATAPVVPA